MNYTIEQISSETAEQLCGQITADLPEYFGLPECNKHYAEGVRERVNFAAKLENTYIALLCIDFPYPKNSNIYWMGVLKQYQARGIGHQLIQSATHYAKLQHATTMSVETLAPTESDKNYLKTYHFYEKVGFSPLFNLKPAGYEWNMVYMVMHLHQRVPMMLTPKAIHIKKLTVDDIPQMVSAFEKHHWPKPVSTFENYLTEQDNQQRLIWLAIYKKQFAGYVTLKRESFYTPFKKRNIPEIMDLNVLPPFRNLGIGSLLLETAEKEASAHCSTVGLGVGLYPDYGNAQKLYIARGYQPDGLGLTYDYKTIPPGEMVRLDDDLILWFTKRLQ